MTTHAHPWLRKAGLVFLHILNLFVIMYVAYATVSLILKIGWWTLAVIGALAIVTFVISLFQNSFTNFFLAYLGFMTAITVHKLAGSNQLVSVGDVLIMAIPMWYTCYVFALAMDYVYTRLRKR